MKNILLTLSFSLTLASCAMMETIEKYWPRDHDPVMFQQLVKLDLAIKRVDCNEPRWISSLYVVEELERYTEWRGDPQHTNIKQLQAHLHKLDKSKNPVFCKIGQRTATMRVGAVKQAWEGR